MKLLFFIAGLLACGIIKAQNTETDSLKKRLSATQDDGKRIIILEGLNSVHSST